MGIWVQIVPTDIGTIDGNVIGYPYYVDGVKFATNENPLYRVTVTEAADSRFRNLKLYTTSSSSESPASWDSLDDSSLKPSYRYSLYYGDTYSGFSNIYENKKISGKYIIPSNVQSLLAKVFIPVNFSIDNANYTGIFSDVLYDDREPNFYMRGDGILVPIMTFNGVISQELVGKVIDFGVVGQNVPSFFYDWVVNSFDRVYYKDYTVKNQNGSYELGSITKAPSMKKLLLNVIGTTKTLTLTGENNREYTITWESQAPEGKVFTGLSFTKNSSVANIGLGVETEISLIGSSTFYEVYSTYRPPLTTFDINLYSNSAEANRVDKTDYLTEVGTLSGVMRDGSSITDLSIIFEMEQLPTFNYVHIPAFNRYYYVNDISTIKYKLWEMRLSVDVLMTYKDNIKALNAFVSRNQYEYDPLIVDNCIPILQGKNIEVIQSPTTFIEDFEILGGDTLAGAVDGVKHRIAIVGTGIIGAES